MAETEINNMEKQPVELVELPGTQEILDRLKCTMCKKFPVIRSGFPFLKLYTCPMGHICCSECAKIQLLKGCTKGLKDFPCKRPITRIEKIPPILEFFYGQSLFKCSFRDCKETLPGCKLEQHLYRCEFGLKISCPDADCPQCDTFTPSKLWRHMLTDHSDKVLTTQEPELLVTIGYYDPMRCVPLHPEELQMVFHVAELFGEKFILICSESGKRYFFYGFVLGGEDVAKKFYFSFELVEKNDEREWPPWNVIGFGKVQGLLKLPELKKLVLEKKALAIKKKDLPRCERRKKNRFECGIKLGIYQK